MAQKRRCFAPALSTILSMNRDILQYETVLLWAYPARAAPAHTLIAPYGRSVIVLWVTVSLALYPALIPTAPVYSWPAWEMTQSATCRNASLLQLMNYLSMFVPSLSWQMFGF
jgi:hypothetical protein